MRSRQPDAIVDIEVIRLARPDDRQALDPGGRGRTGNPFVGPRGDVADPGDVPDDLETIECDMGADLGIDWGRELRRNLGFGLDRKSVV